MNFKIVYKPLLYILALCSMCIAYTSCSKMDDYKKYTEEGEISYTGKVDSLKVYSGKNRVLIQGLFISDPKIVECRIYWNSRKDSLVVPVIRKNKVDTLDIIIEDIPENVHNFEVVTFDHFGNKSVTLHATGSSYGALYQASLLNRPIDKYELFAGDLSLTIRYGKMDLTSGVFATDIRYRDSNNEIKTFRVPIDSTNVVIEDYNIGTDFEYQTLFLPDTSSIDTFYTPFRSLTPDVVYLKNLGHPFARAEWDNSRWGNLADWISNAAVKNAGSNRYGGYELRGGVGVLSMEGGWGLPAVDNGKIYQVTTLPAGKYRFEPQGIDAGANGTRYVAVVLGDQMPNVNDIPSQAYKYQLLTNAGGTIEFELEQTEQVAIGFVGNLPNTGTYFKVKGISFEKIE